MSYIGKVLVIIVSLSVLAGCGLHLYAPTVNVAEYPNKYADFDYHYFWKTSVTDKGFVVDGFLKNVRYANIDSVGMTLAVLDKNGKTIHKASDSPSPQQSRGGDLCSFSLLLKNFKPSPGDIFQFQIQYSSDDGYDSGSSWSSSFKVDALSGTVIR